MAINEAYQILTAPHINGSLRAAFLREPVALPCTTRDILAAISPLPYDAVSIEYLLQYLPMTDVAAIKIRVTATFPQTILPKYDICGIAISTAESVAFWF